MDDHSHVGIWDPKEGVLSLGAMQQRIASCISYRGWQRTMTMLADGKRPLDGLRVAEVGCGTGTFSLTLGLLGASVTLIDFNHNVLDATRKIYRLFDCPARFVLADCLQEAPTELTGVFDFVASGGLAEHFIGAKRSACIAYHRTLLKDGGLAFIGVPNRRSPFYRWIRWFRDVTKTWEIDVEIPYSDTELVALAKEAGFRKYFVLGNAPMFRDLKEYSRGFVSALVDLLPKALQVRARRLNAALTQRTGGAQPPREEIPAQCRTMCESMRRRGETRRHHALADKFSAGLILFAVK